MNPIKTAINRCNDQRIPFKVRYKDTGSILMCEVVSPTLLQECIHTMILTFDKYGNNIECCYNTKRVYI